MRFLFCTGSWKFVPKETFTSFWITLGGNFVVRVLKDTNIAKIYLCFACEQLLMIGTS
jgi:hypothetical protein